MSRTTSPLMDGDLVHHSHNVLICHIIEQESSIQSSQRYLVVSHIGEIVIKPQRNFKEKARIRAQIW